MVDLEPEDSIVFRNLYRPSPGDILYHYCSMEAFEAIVRTGRFRFSDINMMNDFSEMRWGYSVFCEAASRILQESDGTSRYPTREFFDSIDAFLAPSQLVLHPLIACFSREPDILSQWRGYAADGTGVCIGFDAIHLCEMAATFLSCEYDFESQVEQVKARLIGAYALGDEFSPREHAIHLFGYLPSFKNPAFVEEAEVRAVHLVGVTIENGMVGLTSFGGTNFGIKAEPHPIQFSVRREALVAHIDLPFCRDTRIGIQSVVLGPKNANMAGNVSAFLFSHGHRNVQIAHSAATYR